MRHLAYPKMNSQTLKTTRNRLVLWKLIHETFRSNFIPLIKYNLLCLLVFPPSSSCMLAVSRLTYFVCELCSKKNNFTLLVIWQKMEAKKTKQLISKHRKKKFNHHLIWSELFVTSQDSTFSTRVLMPEMKNN